MGWTKFPLYELGQQEWGQGYNCVGRVDSPYWSGSWGYIFPYCPVDEAISFRIDPVENSVVAALGNTYGQESNTRRVKFQYNPF